MPNTINIRAIANMFTVGLLASAAVSAGPTADPADTCQVVMVDGRVLVGAVDERTDDEWLWLRFSEPQITLIRPFAWSSISSIQSGQDVLSVDEFRSTIHEFKSELPAEFFDSEEIPANDENAKHQSRGPSRDEQVVSLRIEAELANWDRNVEADGLYVYVTPFNRQREMVPVDGTVMMCLIGRRPHLHDRRSVFQDVQRWTVPAHAADFQGYHAVYRFPFNVIHPEFDLDLFQHGLLNVRLNVQRQGIFEASVPVHLREYNYLRDQLQLLDGQRFFPNETTRRTRQYYSRWSDPPF